MHSASESCPRFHGFQKIDILPCLSRGIGGTKDITDYGDGIGARLKDFYGAVQRDSADGHDRFTRKRPDAADEFRADNRIGIGFRGRGEDRPDSNVVGGACRGLLKLLEVVRGDANQLPGANDRACFFNAQVFLSYVDTVRTRKGRNVGAVVHNEGDTLWNQSRRELLGVLEKSARGRGLMPVLKQADTGIGQSQGAFCFGNGKQRSV